MFELPVLQVNLLFFLSPQPAAVTFSQTPYQDWNPQFVPDFLHQWTLVTAFTHQLHLPANAFSLPVMTMHPMFLSCSASCSATAISAISASQRAFNALGLFSLMTATLHFSPRFSTSKFWNWPASQKSKWNKSAEENAWVANMQKNIFFVQSKPLSHNAQILYYYIHIMDTKKEVQIC